MEMPAGMPLQFRNDADRIYTTTEPVPASCGFHLGAARPWCFVQNTTDCFAGGWTNEKGDLPFMNGKGGASENRLSADTKLDSAAGNDAYKMFAYCHPA